MSDKEQIELKPRPKTGGPAAPQVLTSDDSGSQALSEALQSSFSIVKVLMVGLVVVFLFSGFFKVESGQQAIILRFGKTVGEGQAALLLPGPHWAFPKPIDEVRKVSIGQIQTATSTVGWYATTPEAEALHQENPPGNTLNPAIDGYALTADANIVHVRATVRYKIIDPSHFLFAYVNAAEFVTNALNNALLFGTTHFTVDEILTGQATPFGELVTAHLRELIASQNLGIEIERVEATPIAPRQLTEKFAEVLQASIKSDDAHNKAETYAQGVVSKARAEAEGIKNTARKQRARLVKQVEAEAKTFAALLPQYTADPELYMSRRRTEAMGRIYEAAQETFALPEDGSQLRLQLNREPQAAPAPKPAE